MRPLAALFVLSLLAAPAAAQLVPEGATPEKVADGYRFTEGPAAGPDGCIYFTDIPAELILKYDPQTGETETFIENSGQANGLMFFESNLMSCEHGARRVGWRTVTPEILVETHGVILDDLTVASAYHTTRLNSPNDLDIDKTGSIYFTDPRYGSRDSMEMDIEGVYYIGLGEELRSDRFDRIGTIRIIDDLTRPNGIVLSPDESILYVADNGTNEIFAYDIEAPGEIENKRLFARLNEGEGGGADGMCVDALGRLYASGQGKIWIYNPDGSSAGVIDVGPQCTNCTFAADGKTLYITANHGLYRIELNTDEALPEVDDPDEKRMGWLGESGVTVEVNAFLPRPISPNAATSIEPQQGTTPWQVFRGTQRSIIESVGGPRSTMSQIWKPAETQLVRILLLPEAYAAFLDWVGDDANQLGLFLLDGEGSRHDLIGFAWGHGDNLMGLCVRDFDPHDVFRTDLFSLETEPLCVYLYFQVPVETEVTGVVCQGKSVWLEDSLEVDR